MILSVLESSIILHVSHDYVTYDSDICDHSVIDDMYDIISHFLFYF